MKTTIYTCAFDNYDRIYPPLRPEPDVAHVLFSDERPRGARGWEWRPIPEAVAGENQTTMNRYCKFFPSRVLGEESGKVAVYVDGNIILKGPVGELARDFHASGADLGLFDHPSRQNLREELEACIRIGKLKGEGVEAGRAQLAHYEAAGLDFDGLSENAILFYNLTSPRLERFGEIWWGELRDRTPRDQLSIAWAIREAGLRVHRFGWSFRERNPYFHRIEHRGNAPRDALHWFEYHSQRSRFHGRALAPARKILRALL